MLADDHGSGTDVSGGLAVVRSLGAARRTLTPAELDDFEQEVIDQRYAYTLEHPELVASSRTHDTT